MERIVRLALIFVAAAALALAAYLVAGRTDPDWLGKRFGAV